MARRKSKANKGKRTHSSYGNMRSGFEKTIAKLFEDNSVAFTYESLKLKYTIEAAYTPDFRIEDIFVETKGHFSALDRKKMKAVKKCNPDRDIRLWFQRDNFLTKAKKDRYSDWASKNGFEYHIGIDFPYHWFDKKTD